jgi:hypothetical protein
VLATWQKLITRPPSYNWHFRRARGLFASRQMGKAWFPLPAMKLSLFGTLPPGPSVTNSRAIRTRLDVPYFRLTSNLVASASDDRTVRTWDIKVMEDREDGKERSRGTRRSRRLRDLRRLFRRRERWLVLCFRPGPRCSRRPTGIASSRSIRLS